MWTFRSCTCFSAKHVCTNHSKIWAWQSTRSTNATTTQRSIKISWFASGSHYSNSLQPASVWLDHRNTTRLNPITGMSWQQVTHMVTLCDPCPIGRVFGADLTQIIFRSLPSSSSSCPCRKTCAWRWGRVVTKPQRQTLGSKHTHII